MFIFFTELTKQDVLDRHGRWLGRPFDFTVGLEEAYPRLTELVIVTGLFRRRYYVIPWNKIHHSGGQFQLKVSIDTLTQVSSYVAESGITLRKKILDQQVVDTFNRRVVRVNDVHLLQVDNSLRIAHVDIGVRGLVRRLNWERFVDAVVRFLNRHSRYLLAEKFIPWKYIQPLSIQPLTGKIHLNVDHAKLRSIPPPDLSEMLMELDTYHRAALFKSLDPQSQIDILTELELKWQADLVEELDPKTTVDLLEKMPADEATDLLGALPRKDSERFLEMLPPKKSRELIELLKHEVHSAGGLMTKEFVDLKEDIKVGDALDDIFKVKLKKAETIYNSYIVDDDFKLIGIVSLRQLLNADRNMKLSEIMLTKPPCLNIGDSLKDVATMLAKYNYFAAPVIDDEGTLKGIITVDDVLAVIIEEAWGRNS